MLKCVSSQILSNDGLAADIGDREMRRENGPSGYAFLGRDIRDDTHRHRVRYRVHTTATSLHTLQRDPTADSRHSAAASRLLYKTPIVDLVQCPDTARADTVVQYRDVVQRPLRADRRGDRAVPQGDRSFVRGDSHRRGETGRCRSLGCLHLIHRSERFSKPDRHSEYTGTNDGTIGTKLVLLLPFSAFFFFLSFFFSLVSSPVIRKKIAPCIIDSSRLKLLRN